jgi:prophage maintenance system killer protein
VDELDLGDILALHIDSMGRIGKWPAPAPDEPAILAILRQVKREAESGSDPIRQASALAVEIAQVRPFADGNLPTALAALETHLLLHGLEIRLGSHRTIAQYLRVISEEHEPDFAIGLPEGRLRNAVVPRGT